jgi:hypothetical protein
MKRSYRLPRKLVYSSFPLAFAGVMACGDGTPSSSQDLASSSTDMAARPCYGVNDMLIPLANQPACVNISGQAMTCPEHACVPADCPSGCAYPFA